MQPCLKAFGVAGLLGALALMTLSHLYGVSLRAAGLIEGKGALRTAYRHMLERGYPTNFGNPYTIWINTNVIELNGTTYQITRWPSRLKFPSSMARASSA